MGLEDMLFHSWNALKPRTWVTNINNTRHMTLTWEILLCLFSFHSPWREPCPLFPLGGNNICSMTDFEAIEVKSTLKI